MPGQRCGWHMSVDRNMSRIPDRRCLSRPSQRSVLHCCGGCPRGQWQSLRFPAILNTETLFFFVHRIPFATSSECEPWMCQCSRCCCSVRVLLQHTNTAIPVHNETVRAQALSQCVLRVASGQTLAFALLACLVRARQKRDTVATFDETTIVALDVLLRKRVSTQLLLVESNLFHSCVQRPSERLSV